MHLRSLYRYSFLSARFNDKKETVCVKRAKTRLLYLLLCGSMLCCQLNSHSSVLDDYTHYQALYSWRECIDNVGQSIKARLKVAHHLNGRFSHDSLSLRFRITVFRTGIHSYFTVVLCHLVGPMRHELCYFMTCMLTKS